MSHSRAEFPEGIELPDAFAHDERLREWFVTGVHDGIDEMGLPREDGFSHSHEPGAWEAYRAGYEAGRQWRREFPDPLMEEDDRS